MSSLRTGIVYYHTNQRTTERPGGYTIIFVRGG